MDSIRWFPEGVNCPIKIHGGSGFDTDRNYGSSKVSHVESGLERT